MSTRRPPLIVDEAADYLNQPTKAIYTLCWTGGFPNAYKIGAGKKKSATRIPVADIERDEKTQPRVHSN